MDKKKVKELIEQIQKYCDQAYNPNWQPKSFEEFIKLGNICREAIKEINKSDWVSVEDGLPPYEEDVLVCNEDEPSDIWFGHRTPDRRVIVDEHEFAKGYGTITHWRKIDKLED